MLGLHEIYLYSYERSADSGSELPTVTGHNNGSTLGHVTFLRDCHFLIAYDTGEQTTTDWTGLHTGSDLPNSWNAADNDQYAGKADK